MPERFYVAVTTGYLMPYVSRNRNARPGLTASVLDTGYLHREVARFRSEDYSVGSRPYIVAQNMALDAAEADCARRNEEYAEWLTSA